AVHSERRLSRSSAVAQARKIRRSEACATDGIRAARATVPSSRSAAAVATENGAGCVRRSMAAARFEAPDLHGMVWLVGAVPVSNTNACLVSEAALRNLASTGCGD